MTCDVQWLFLAGVGGTLLWIALAQARGARHGKGLLPRLLDDPRRIVLLVGLPFAIRLVQLGQERADPYAFPPVTLPTAAWSVWVASLLLLALPLLLAPWPGRPSRPRWPAVAVAGLAALVLVVGLVESPFDRAGLERALVEHATYADGILARVPRELVDLRQAAEEVAAREKELARSEALATFGRRGLPPAAALLAEHRQRLAAAADEWENRVRARREEEAARRRREYQAARSVYYD